MESNIWISYGLDTVKKGEPELTEVVDDGDDDERNNTVGGETKMEANDKATTKLE